MLGVAFSPSWGGGTQSLSFWYGPRLRIAGNLPPSSGRNTSAFNRAPSRIGTSTSFSTFILYEVADGFTSTFISTRKFDSHLSTRTSRLSISTLTFRLWIHPTHPVLSRPHPEEHRKAMRLEGWGRPLLR